MTARMQQQTPQNDPSQRFILPEDAPYLANLAALWAVDAKLAAAIDALHESNPYEVEQTKDGLPTISVQAPDDRTLYLHSRYRPIEEAEKLIDTVQVEDRGIFYACGFGLGYHV